MPHPHASLKILALLDHNQLSVEDLSKRLGKAQSTLRRQAGNMIRWGQIEVVDERIRMVPNGRVNRRGKAVITQVRTRILKTTDRGRARLEKKGGHKLICPSCVKEKPKRG